MVDSVKQVLYRVTIDGTAFNGASPSDGFVDPTKTEEYMAVVTKDGDQVSPTVSNGDTIKINGISITFTTAGGLNIAGIIATINKLTHLHHVVASANGSSELRLTNQTLYEGDQFSVQGDPAVLAALGFDNPTEVAAPVGPTSIAESLNKERGNMRWEKIIENLSLSGSLTMVDSVVKAGATINAQPTQIDFTIGYQLPSIVYIDDELNPGEFLEGIPAVRRMIARSLTQTKKMPRFIYDSSETSGITLGGRIYEVEARRLAADIPTAEAEITVDVIINTK